MGTASSQVRLLGLTSERSSVSLQMEQVSTEQMQLTRAARKYSAAYQEALNKKTLSLSFNNGVSYVALSYSNLMSPNSTNSYKPMFITDSNSRVVISNNYLKYAEMISDGTPGSEGDWSNVRTSVLTDLIGISAEDLEKYENGSDQNILTADQKSLIDFYDVVFNTIAKNGWTFNSQVSDDDYLNESLQNGYYYITTYEVSAADDGGYDLTYETDLAVNNENIFQVNNSTKNDAALAKYEALKSRVSEKESLLDQRMQNLQTEYDSITEMIESIKKTIEDNIEAHMKVFA